MFPYDILSFVIPYRYLILFHYWNINKLRIFCLLTFVNCNLFLFFKLDKKAKQYAENNNNAIIHDIITEKIKTL